MNFHAADARSGASPRAVATVRCAVYTRKSSEEGLDQTFNSLEAQREAGTDYIRSQKHAGWVALPDRYDDGGYSGGSTDRPGLQRLLDDITLGRVDVVVVYKVDRLSRSLADFARLMQLFDEKGVSFVSVTQQFNTTTSMGRLTLNMLLSFAQFEREVAGERIRDKIAATFRKGIFVTGQPPLGYRRPGAEEPGASERTLLIVPEEAAIIRAIYAGYLELGSLVELTKAINAAGHRTRRWTSATGRTTGGRPFTTSLLYRILTNPIYLGKVTHTRRVADGSLHANHGHSRSSFRTDIYDGRHAPIIDRAVWDRVQEQMNTAQRDAQRRWTHTHLLKGKLRTFERHAMSPGSTHRPASKRADRGEDQRLVRYYVSQKAIKSGYASCPIKALNAGVIDDLVRAAVVQHLNSSLGVDLRPFDAAERDRHIRGVIARVEIAPERVTIELSKAALVGLKESLTADRGDEASGAGNALTPPSLSSKQPRSKRSAPAATPGSTHSAHAAAPRSPVPECRFTPEIDERRDTVALRIAVQIKRHDGRRLILSPDGRDLTLNGGSDRSPTPSAHIVRAIGLAYSWREELLSTGKTIRTLADEHRIALTRVKLLLQLINLSPQILKATLTGTLPLRVTLKNLHAAARELDWSKQAAILGID